VSTTAPRPDLSVRHILCPIDFSAFSRRAVEEAVPLAKAFGADITALFVYPLEPSNAAEGAPVIPDEGARSAVAADLAPFLAPARAAGVPVEVRQRAGDPVTEILDEARRIGAGLIAMGTHGRSGLQKLVLGSVADAVLERAPCPVLTVARSGPRPASGPVLDGILCAVDLTEGSRRTLAGAFDLAAVLRVPVTILHVFAAGGDDETWWERRGHARERLHDAVALAAPRQHPEENVVSGRPSAEILRLAAERRSSWIVLGTPRGAEVGLALCGSTAEHVIREAPCPVITVRGAADAEDAPAEVGAAAREG
jgi:nucleotide-binding universal stress UspA family protein